MCGIAGFLSNRPEGEQRQLLRAMCDRIAYRGPDGDGYYADGEAALGHRRLAIIDLTGGAQPLGNEDGSVQIVFNGEIYNYQELRRKLDGRHHFRTASDTEVMVHLYEDEGPSFCEQLNGMFAVVIWNRKTGEIFCARDRFGEKPFYYTEAIPGIRLAFASELKAFRALDRFPSEVDEQSIADYLSLGYVPDPQTIYRHVHKLPPAHWLKMGRDGVLKTGRYWTPLFRGAAPPATLEEGIEQAGAAAAEAVRLRMISDVPLGAFLSGGVDSSLVVGYMSRHAPGKVKTYSIGFTEKEYDELEYANLVAERFGTSHQQQVVSPRIEEVLSTLLNHYDEPFADSSAIPMLYLARMTRQHVTVALSGDGADELFAGYRRYCYGAIEAGIRARFPGWFRRPVFGTLGSIYPKFDFLPRPLRAKTLLIALSQEIGDSYFTSMATFRDQAYESVLSGDLRRKLNGYSPRASYRARFEKYADLGPLEQLQAVDLETYLPGDILVKTDRATMAYSLEGRAPWLDNHLSDFALRLPAAYKVQGTTGKLLFKKLAERNVPPQVVWRPKMGFTVPLAQWLRTSLRELFESVVLGSGVADLIDIGSARRLWNEHQSGLSNHDRKLWTLLILGCWYTGRRDI